MTQKLSEKLRAELETFFAKEDIKWTDSAFRNIDLIAEIEKLELENDGWLAVLAHNKRLHKELNKAHDENEVLELALEECNKDRNHYEAELRHWAPDPTDISVWMKLGSEARSEIAKREGKE